MFARVALLAAVSAAGAMAVCDPLDHGPFTMSPGTGSGFMTMSFGVDDADNTMVCHTIVLGVTVSNSFQAMCIGQSMTASSCVVAAEGGAIIPIDRPQTSSNTPTSTPVFTADAYSDNGSQRVYGFTRGGYSATAGTDVVYSWNPSGGGTLSASNATQASKPHTSSGRGCLNAAAGVFTSSPCPATTGVATTATTGTTTATTATTSTGVASTTGTTTATTATTSTGVASTGTTGAGNGTGTGNSTTGTGNSTAVTTGTTTGSSTTGINPTTGNAASAATSLVAPLALLAAGAAAAAL